MIPIRLVILMLTAVSAFAQTNRTSHTNKFKPYVPPAVAVAPASDPKTIIITSIDGTLGTYYKCTVSGAPVSQLFIAGLPATLKSAFDSIKSLESQIASESISLKAATKQLRAELAAAPSTAPSDTPAGNYIRQLNIRENQILEREKDLEEQRAKLRDAKAGLLEINEISARPLGRNYAGLPIWQVVATKPTNASSSP